MAKRPVKKVVKKAAKKVVKKIAIKAMKKPPARKKRNGPKRESFGVRIRKAQERGWSLVETVKPSRAKAVSAGIGTLISLRGRGVISRHQLLSIMNAPVKDRTLAVMLRNLGMSRTNITSLLEDVEKAYATQVPERVQQRLLKCKKGTFLKEVYAVARAYRSPRTYITARALDRMRLAGEPEDRIKEFTRMVDEIDELEHKRKAAKRSKRDADVVAYGRMKRAIYRNLVDNFIRQL